jgi:mono/diheme cytochrome c family protein
MMRTIVAAGALAGLALAACTSGPRSAAGFRLPAGDVERGRATFVEMRCHACHRVSGQELPTPVADPPVPVELGGLVYQARTDGELVSAIINPSYRLAPGYARETITNGRLSRMGDVNDELSVRELADLVAFLHSTYVVTPAPIEPYGH